MIKKSLLYSGLIIFLFILLLILLLSIFPINVVKKNVYSVDDAAIISMYPGYVGNLLNEQGTGINPLTYDKLIANIGDLGLDGCKNSSELSNKSIVFQMGEVNGNPIYWRVVYRTDDYITIWMTQPYSGSIFNTYGDSGGEIGSLTDENLQLVKKHFSKIHPDLLEDDYTPMAYYKGYTNYSKSYLRDVTLAIFYDLVQSSAFPFVDTITISPQEMEDKTGTNWQSSQDAVTFGDMQAVTNGLGGYSTSDKINNSFNDISLYFSPFFIKNMWLPVSSR